MRWFLLATSVFSLSLSSCGRTQVPLPPIAQAPAEVAALRVFVWNASNEAAQKANETTVTGYTIQMRGAMQRTLSRAGITVVVSPNDPADLVAKIDTENPGINKPGMAAMTLATPSGVVVEQLSEMIVLDENVDIDERGPVQLTQKMMYSSRILAFARGNRRGECERIEMPRNKVLEVPDSEQ